MQNRRNKIGLGTVQFGLDYGIGNSHGQTSNKKIQKILNTAKENQIQILETASAYERREKIFGKHNLPLFNYVTKFLEKNSRQFRKFL